VAASAPLRFTLNMHGLGTPHSGVPDSERRYWCDAGTFEALLDEMVRLDGEYAGKVSFHVTFDDGNKSDLTIGVPALKARDLTATFFVCSDRLGDPAYLSVVDLGLMEADGMTIGCHGASHIPLRGVTPDTLEYETRRAKIRLEDALGHEVSAFAIPFGSYDRKVMKALDPFDEIHTSDHQLSRTGTRLVMRHSYVDSWEPGTLSSFVKNAPAGFRAMVVQAKLAAKRLRP
jgi:peptidoglycan/xylan/chitin deacetylase (PgdA/CDA1 family)